jgi:hypothetical protein
MRTLYKCYPYEACTLSGFHDLRYVGRTQNPYVVQLKLINQQDNHQIHMYIQATKISYPYKSEAKDGKWLL